MKSCKIIYFTLWAYFQVKDFDFNTRDTTFNCQRNFAFSEQYEYLILFVPNFSVFEADFKDIHVFFLHNDNVIDVFCFRACCGEGFSIFASDNGIVLTCGDGTSGCLGHGDTLSCYRPRLIETLLR